ncbi:putative Sec7 domain, armadillo-like helical, sec7 domain superfamily protein [Helianthus annuus]|nr:putative Sec7 domain, armadillo-like helical, sec7 domain superfamily protein [Helianthus annuus]
MSSLGGQSRCGWLLGPSLDKIIKNAAWRKHSHIVAASKSALDKLQTLADDPSSSTSLYGVSSSSDLDLLLLPLILAVDSSSPKVVEPALDCCYKLFSLRLIRGEIDLNANDDSGSIVSRLIDSVCKCSGLGEEIVELLVVKTLLSVVRSTTVLVKADCLNQIVKTCYNIYLGGVNGTNQICAKAVLAQMMAIIFARVEADSVQATFNTVSVTELLEFNDRGLSEGSSVQFAQNLINEVVFTNVVDVVDGSGDVTSPVVPEVQEEKGGEKVGEGEGELGEKEDLSGYTKIRDSGVMVFKNLCKLSMKFSSQEQSDDQILLRGKMLSLELLKVIMDNAGPIWRTNERFINVIKQFLCLSLLKNSALSVMSIFQLLCSIFQSLLIKYRSVLKSEIGIFFPMLILRVLENVLQPSFIQKMTILNLLDKISQDSQIMIDIFVNYDCDVDSPNIFERTVNGLLKTALGPPPGSTTTLTPVHDLTFRFESVKCLVIIVKSMGAWMDQQLRIGEFGVVRSTPDNNDTALETSHTSLGGDEVGLSDFELHQETINDHSTATLEQRRTYKLELQKGISLFNRKPSKGIEFLISNKKVDATPEAVALFLKNTSGLNETVIGDYLGEREDFSLKVMHAYVDSFKFDGMDFGEAIRFFLRGFRLPGEAQKIDRIMEKFAERYCKCNPNSFTSADTAYVLAYSVIMLNTDAHNSMVKDKMSKADFIRNNRGIDDGKDLPEESLGALYDQIVKNEIKMKADTSIPQSKQTNSVNRLLGLDGILNLVWKQTEEKPLGANGALIKHIQEQFKEKSGKSESTYYAVTDAAILRFMVEVCWGPMLAAFSMTLDQSDDRAAANYCLQGFRHAVHVTAVMGMQTQRDAFVTTVAKFTYLHCAADMKQKNVDAVKAIIAIAIEDGNYLQDSWEHILTCLSRFEHLQLLGEGAPSDASFLSGSNVETTEDKSLRNNFPSLKKKGTLQNPVVMAVVRGSSYDSTSLGANTSGLVTPDQISSFLSNLNLLEQIGNFELNHIFAHSQRLDSEAIVAFVKALCKVSMSELQSPTDPRVFSLTKIVEVAHYNMNRIRLVWSRIWSVLSDFFVSVGLSENLSVAIFVMDSLRQLSMKFLEREELANYNFQNEFLRPFVIVMQKSNSVEIRELIVRCLSQMILSRVGNVKSGWKSVFMALTAAAADERKNVVVLAFETMEKIVREYFPYITETETATFTDCVRCLITFTNSRFDSDVSLNAIAFLRFCAVKLAEGGLICNTENVAAAADGSSVSVVKEADGENLTDVDENASYWIPLLSGLSLLTSDPRLAIRKSSLEVLFNILKDHGHVFSRSFWITVINSVIFPVFKNVSGDNKEEKDQSSPKSSCWDSETCSVATRCLVDLFINFFGVMRAHLGAVVSLVAGLLKNTGQGCARSGVSGLMRLVGELGGMLTEDEWACIFLSLKETAASLLPSFLKLLKIMDRIEIGMPNVAQSSFYDDDDDGRETPLSSSNGAVDNYDDDNLQTAGYVVSRMKTHISTQLLIMQVATDLYNMQQHLLKASSVKIVLELFSQTVSHAHELSANTGLHLKLQRACSILEITDPPVVHFENESYQNILNLLHHLLTSDPSLSEEMGIEAQLFSICREIIQMYLSCCKLEQQQLQQQKPVHWILPLNSAVKDELGVRTSLLVSALRVLSEVDRERFRRYASALFPLLVELVRCEHTSREVQPVLSNLFQTCIGPIIMNV